MCWSLTQGLRGHKSSWASSLDLTSLLTSSISFSQKIVGLWGVASRSVQAALQYHLMVTHSSRFLESSFYLWPFTKILQIQYIGLGRKTEVKKGCKLVMRIISQCVRVSTITILNISHLQLHALLCNSLGSVFFERIFERNQYFISQGGCLILL